jgi:glycosyltransferase involved in cell wall biosynthesis
MARVLVFDPYFRTLGGGERMIVELGETLAATHDVTYAAPELPPARSLTRVGFPALDVRALPSGRLTETSAEYDHLIHLTNTPPRPSAASRSTLVVQFPFRRLSRRPTIRVAERRALATYDCFAISGFTQRWLRRRWRVDAPLLTPPVVLRPFDVADRQRMILGIGRFSPRSHTKRQDALIEAFRRFAPAHPGWELVLAGSMRDDPVNVAHMRSLETAATGLPVRFAVNTPPDELDALLRHASFFWHATGFERSRRQPHLAEHFGIAVVEAMSAGCIPLVFDDGGQRELVQDGAGVAWRTLDELVDATGRLVAAPDDAAAMRATARARSEEHSVERYRAEVRRVLA